MNKLTTISTDALKAMLVERQARVAALQTEIEELTRELAARNIRKLKVVR